MTSCVVMIISFDSVHLFQHINIILSQRKLCVENVWMFQQICCNSWMSWHVSNSDSNVFQTFPHVIALTYSICHKCGGVFDRGDVFVSQRTIMGTMESVCIDIVTKMWHPPHSTTVQRNFPSCCTGSDWSIQGATGSRETYISQLEASTLQLWNNKHRRVCVTHSKFFPIKTFGCCC